MWRDVPVASESGHLEVVRLLLKQANVDASANNNRAIQLASENGHLEVGEWAI